MDDKELDAQPMQQDEGSEDVVLPPKEAENANSPNPEQLPEEELLRRQKRAKRREEMKRQKEQQLLMRRRIRLGVIAAAVVICIAVGAITAKSLLQNPEGEETETVASNQEEESRRLLAANPGIMRQLAQQLVPQLASGNAFLQEYAAEHAAYRASSALFYEGYSVGITEDTPVITSEEVISSYAVLVDLDSGEVVAQKAAEEIINPASMTKILTLLVAAEHISDLDDTFTVTAEITDFAYRNDCSVAGFEKEETVTVRDLLYGTILPSGGDAAAALAVYTAGSMDNFVDLMNDKLKELGLSETAHFTNCVGLYDENHFCTVCDMAMILKAAVENDLCREVLSAHTYTTSQTPEHPDGLTLSNWFLRRIEDKDTHGEVVCAKTGFVNQSGSCGASYAVSHEGKHYICVTGDAWSSWRCIYDHVAIYQEYTN